MGSLSASRFARRTPSPAAIAARGTTANNIVLCCPTWAARLGDDSYTEIWGYCSLYGSAQHLRALALRHLGDGWLVLIAALPRWELCAQLYPGIAGDDSVGGAK